MKTIEKLENKLAILRNQLKLTSDPDVKAKLDERIDFIQDDIDELEEAEADRIAYEETTGITPQDLYDERNSYDIRQGEMIDQFRNEI